MCWYYLTCLVFQFISEPHPQWLWSLWEPLNGTNDNMCKERTCQDQNFLSGKNGLLCPNQVAGLPKSEYLVQKKCPKSPLLSWNKGSFLFLRVAPFFKDKAACSEHRYVMMPYLSPLNNKSDSVSAAENTARYRWTKFWSQVSCERSFKQVTALLNNGFEQDIQTILSFLPHIPGILKAPAKSPSLWCSLPNLYILWSFWPKRAHTLLCDWDEELVTEMYIVPLYPPPLSSLYYILDS